MHVMLDDDLGHATQIDLTAARLVRLVSCRAMPAVGSSSSRSFGCWIRHIASSRRRLLPREAAGMVVTLVCHAKVFEQVHRHLLIYLLLRKRPNGLKWKDRHGTRTQESSTL